MSDPLKDIPSRYPAVILLNSHIAVSFFCVLKNKLRVAILDTLVYLVKNPYHTPSNKYEAAQATSIELGIRL